jgi:hypothetical protein
MAFVGAGRATRRGGARCAGGGETGNGDNAAFTPRGRARRLPRADRLRRRRLRARRVELLRPVRPVANRFGGSHAQRDVIDLTLIEAAFRSGQPASPPPWQRARRGAAREPAVAALRRPRRPPKGPTMKPRDLILAAFTALVPAAASADGALRAFDVAEDLSRFVHDEAPVFDDGMPAFGNAFVTQGYVYPAGTLDGGVEGTTPEGGPAFPDKVIGT